MSLYQICFALKPHMEEDAVKAIKDRIGVFIGQNGGKLENIEEIGRKKLAYEVEGEKEGIFIRVFFDMDPSSLEEFLKWMKTQDEVIRSILIRRKIPKVKSQKERESYVRSK